jgi:ribosomal-protein-alanine N-acetyltransferase
MARAYDDRVERNTFQILRAFRPDPPRASYVGLEGLADHTLCKPSSIIYKPSTQVKRNWFLSGEKSTISLTYDEPLSDPSLQKLRRLFKPQGIEVECDKKENNCRVLLSASDNLEGKIDNLKRNILPYQIRHMIRRDSPEVLDIERQTFEFPWTEEDFLACQRQRNCIGMVIEHHERVVGYMIYELLKNELHVLTFAVAPWAREEGIGSLMIDRLKDKLFDQRRKELTLEVRETNLVAQLFFKQHGLKATNVIRGHYEDTDEDAYVMAYNIKRQIVDKSEGSLKKVRGNKPPKQIMPEEITPPTEAELKELPELVIFKKEIGKKAIELIARGEDQYRLEYSNNGKVIISFTSKLDERDTIHAITDLITYSQSKHLTPLKIAAWIQEKIAVKQEKGREIR